MPATARSLATRALVSVIQRGQSLNTVLHTAPVRSLSVADQRLYRELLQGTLRWHDRLAFQLDALLDRPLKTRDTDVRAALLLGLYQLTRTRIPDHAAVAETVALARTLRKEWATGLINGVLRRFQRERETLEQAADAHEPARWSHPAWFIQALRSAWPDSWRPVLEADQAHPPMMLRSNRLQTTREALQQQLAAADIVAYPHPVAPDALVLEQPREVEGIPGFAAGLWSVQDAAAQLAAGLLDAGSGHRVLDACAAPGGKACHILELCPGSTLVAVESDPARAQRIRDNLARLQLHAQVRVADAGQPGLWWDGEPFQRILLDVPCSGTGVIRRHPDIKLLRRVEDIPAFAAQQRTLLAGVWPLLAPGGKLLYCTCSVLPAENGTVVQGFLDTVADARAVALPEHWGRPAGPGRQILPGEHDMDGFFYACLVKAGP